MATIDTDSLTIESSVAFSLPDPTLVSGRSHNLTNSANGGIVVSSVGATPFQTGGINTATVTIPAGGAVRYQSDGVRWVARSGSGSRAFYAGTAVTAGSGDATFAFPAGLFAVAPVVQAAVQAADSASPLDYRITALSATSVTIRVRSSPATVIALLGLTLLGASVVINGITVHLFATPAGATP